jgi:hypothetical protein
MTCYFSHVVTDSIPPFERAEFDGNKLLNAADHLPLWSGTMDPPAIGSIVITSGHVQHRATITGYKVVERWLMAVGFRTDEPNHKGDLAGIEILRVESSPA